ncbi:hypothetical protein ACJJTC_017517 [Scirpophaga incertulas]
MSKGKGAVKRTEGKVVSFDHLIFSVANAKMVASYFQSRFGFKPLAVREQTESNPAISHAVRLNAITIVFQSPTSSNGVIAQDLAAHGDFVKDVAFEVEDLEQLVKRAKGGGAEVVQDIAEERDDSGFVKYAVLRTYGDNTHTLVDRSQYNGLFWPGYKPVEEDPLNILLPDTNLLYIDHVEGNMVDGTLEDSVAWYEKNLNMHKFWCVDYKHDLVPYSCISSASVINRDENVLLSMNEAAKGLRPTSKATEFVKALGTSGVEHIALYTDDIVATMCNLQARGAEILHFPPTYYDIIKEQLSGSSLQISEDIEEMRKYSILIDFDERGYMLQAFLKHLQARPTVFIEVLQRRNHRGFGAMNYKWVFEAIERMDSVKQLEEAAKQIKIEA